MKEEYEVALKGPKTILLCFILFLGIIGLALLNQLGNHMDVAGPVYFAVLFSFVVPYFLCKNYPKIAGWLLILEGIIPIHIFLLILFNPYPIFGIPSKIIIGISLFLLIPMISGIWMINAIRKVSRNV